MGWDREQSFEYFPEMLWSPDKRETKSPEGRVEEIKKIIREGSRRLEESILTFGKGYHQQKAQFDVVLPLELISRQ